MITLTPEEARKRLESNDNLAVIVKHNYGVGIRHSIGTGYSKKTPEERELITNIAIEEKLNGVSYKETARSFGVHHDTVDSYIHGQSHSDARYNSEGNVRKPEQYKELVSSKAMDRLVSALDLLTEDKLTGADANDLSNVAVRMATVQEKLNGNNKDGPAIQVVIVTPPVMKEKHFEVIEV